MAGNAGMVKYFLNGLELEVDTETGAMLENSEEFRRNYEILIRQQIGDQLMITSHEDNSDENEIVEDFEVPNDTSHTEKMWTTENVLFLINEVQKFDKEFSCGVKKNIWNKVAESCKTKNKLIMAKHCETKWKSLTRTYKKILTNNNTSGQKRRYWEYFDVMHNILFKKPEINEVATCSSLSGLHLKTKSKMDEQSETSASSFSENAGSCKDQEDVSTKMVKENPAFESSFSKKRKQRATEQERRHKEKMARMDRFNDLFEKMVNKMPEPKE